MDEVGHFGGGGRRERVVTDPNFLSEYKCRGRGPD